MLRPKGVDKELYIIPFTTNISIRINNSIISDQRNVAEVFGDYFSTMANEIGGQHVLQHVEEDFNTHVSVEAIHHSHQSLHFEFNKKIDPRAIKNELEKLNTHKATKWDAISNRILKPMAVSLAPSLTNFFNTCIRSGQWPSNWKREVWTPVFKKEDRADYSNYRLVTVLNAVAKVFESLLSKQITERIDTHLYHKLSAYRKTHSCETNLVRVTEDWRKAMDNMECIAVLSADMSKAFDSFHHALMIKKLETHGFSDMSLELMRSYFIERKNCVNINNVTSTWKDQLRGCPQGSPLGPLLWSLFQNDLSLNVHTSNLFMYADDHQVYQSGSNITAAISELTKEAENESLWYKGNLLHANPKKYQILAMTPRHIEKEAKDECTLDIDNQKLKPTANLRILGVNIDD